VIRLREKGPLFRSPQRFSRAREGAPITAARLEVSPSWSVEDGGGGGGVEIASFFGDAHVASRLAHLISPSQVNSCRVLDSCRVPPVTPLLWLAGDGVETSMFLILLFLSPAAAG
jgi:hypothetical protein